MMSLMAWLYCVRRNLVPFTSEVFGCFVFRHIVSNSILDVFPSYGVCIVGVSGCYFFFPLFIYVLEQTAYVDTEHEFIKNNFCFEGTFDFTLLAQQCQSLKSCVRSKAKQGVVSS